MSASSTFNPALSSRIPALDGIRGMAILLVMLHHFTMDITAEAWLPKLCLRILGAGWFGVDLFFVLSGFLITGILYDAKDSPGYFKSFYMRRVLRIFPLYYGVLLLVFVAAPLLSNAITAQTAEVGANQGWLWGYGTNFALAWKKTWIFDSDWVRLGHFWSLAVEEQFYMIWPFVVLLCRRETLVKTCLAVIALALGIRILLHLFDGHYLPIYVLTPCRMDALAAGALLALVARGPRGLDALVTPSRILAVISGLFLLAVFVKRRQFLTNDPAIYTLGFSALCLIFAALLVQALGSQPQSATARFWNCSALRFFGKYSYGLYVFHLPLQMVVWHFFSPDVLAPYLGSQLAGFLAYLGFVFAMSIAAAFLSWHLFEKHFLELKRLFPMRGSPPARKAQFLPNALVRDPS